MSLNLKFFNSKPMAENAGGLLLDGTVRVGPVSECRVVM